MKIKDLPLSLKEKWNKKLKNLLTLIMIIIIIFTSLGIFILRDFGLGYKYYEITDSYPTYIGATKEKNLLTETIEEYLEQLDKDGYYIVSSGLNKTITNTFTVVPKSQINTEDIKKVIIEHLDVIVLTTRLNIEGDNTIYYFKTQDECDNFVKELNQYIEQTTSSEGLAEDYRVITKQETLDKKIQEVKDKKEEQDKVEAQRKAEQQRKISVSSRGGVNRSYSGGAPMASYTYISSYYGMRNGSMHTGVDFAAPSGTPIYAWKSGTVSFVGWQGGYGNFIIVNHGDGTVSRYAHCSGFAVSAGQSVEKGQTIGYVGTTGNSTGNHLHFEIQVNGTFVNPLNYL